MDLRTYTDDEFKEEWAQMTQRDKDRLSWFVANMQLSDKRKTEVRPAHEVQSVYFIQNGDLIKIGRSSHIRDRMLVLRREVKGDLVLLGRIPTSAIKEHAVHIRFAHLRQHGEWFTDCDELRSYIAEYAEQEVQQPTPARPRRATMRNSTV